jgi:hypothetical protein
MTYSRILTLAFVAFAGAASTQVLAQERVSDARCLLVSNIFANSAKEAKARSLASSARLFYGGRVSALPNARIQTEMLAQQKQVTAANAAATMNACSRGMDQALRNIQAVGQKLQQPAR